jgi:hypothetical protein
VIVRTLRTREDTITADELALDGSVEFLSAVLTRR